MGVLAAAQGVDIILLLPELVIAVVTTVGKVYRYYTRCSKSEADRRRAIHMVIGNGGKSSQFVGGGGTKEW